MTVWQPPDDDMPPLPPSKPQWPQLEDELESIRDDGLIDDLGGCRGLLAAMAFVGLVTLLLLALVVALRPT